jgi:hypothetical protein
MARRSGKSTRKRPRRRHWLDAETSENLPACTPVDLNLLPKETRDATERWLEWLKATEPAARAAREASKELHERFARRAAYRAAVRDGLLPPPYLKTTKRKRKPSKPRGREPRIDRVAIAKIAANCVADHDGVPPTKPGREPSADGLIAAVYASLPENIEPPSETVMKEICGPIAKAWLLSNPKEGR